MKTAEIIALGNDTVVFADATNEEPSTFGRVLDVADRYATIRVTDIDGNVEQEPVIVGDTQGITFGWESRTPYTVRRHWERPLVDDFGNVVTQPTGRTVSVYVGRVKETADEIKAQRAERKAEAEKRAAESRRKQEQADLVLASLRDLLPESLAHSSYLRAYDADAAFDLYNAIVKEAEVAEVQPNVYSVKVTDPSRFGTPETIEATILHLVDADTYAFVGDRAEFDPAEDRNGFGFHSEHALAMAALLASKADAV